MSSSGERDPDEHQRPPNPAQSQDQARSVIDGLPAMISYWGSDLRNRMANSTYIDYYGLTPAEIQGMHARDLLGEEMFELNVPHMRAALAGEPQLFDRELPDTSGRIHYTQISYMPDEVDGEVRGFFVLVADITARVLAERDARRGISRYRSLVHSLPGGFVLLFDDQMRFEVADGEALETFGYTRELLEGRTLHEAISPELVAELEPRYLAALAGETRNWERLIGARSFSLTCGPVRDEDGSVFAGAVVCIDNTPQRRAAALDRTLHEVARAVAGSADLDQVVGTIVRQLDDLFGFSLCTVVRFDGDGDGTVLATSREAGFLGQRLELGQDDGTANARVALTGAPATVVFDPDLSGIPAAAYAAGLRASAAAPIFVHGQLWGAIGLASDDPKNIDEEVLTRLSAFADLVDLAIANTNAWEALTERAETDAMTGLLNRASFQEQLALLVARSRAEGTPLAMAILDVDHFKAVNDAFGHQVGDEALCLVADRLRTSAREGDVLARIGGEEFAWILPRTTPEQAWHAAERARHTVSAEPHEYAGRLTISIGVAALEPIHSGPGLLSLAADRAMYAAKRWGRNRTIVSGGIVNPAAPAGR